jgi:hypothetical protein
MQMMGNGVLGPEDVERRGEEVLDSQGVWESDCKRAFAVED